MGINELGPGLTCRKQNSKMLVRQYRKISLTLDSPKDFINTFKQSTEHKRKDGGKCQNFYLELIIIKDTIRRIKTQASNWEKLFAKYTTVKD